MAGTLRTTLQLELDTTLTKFQEEYHYPDKKIANDRVIFKSSFEVEKTTWRTKIRDELKMDADGGRYRYTPNYGYDHLHSSTIEFTLPEIKVKDEFKKHVEICWSPNIGHNVIKEGALYLDNGKAQTITTKWLDMHAWAYIKNVKKYNKLIGAVPCLTTWSKHLPQYPISVPQIWFYKNVEHPLPIIGGDNKSVNSSIYHQYRFELNIANLLRIRVREGDDDEFKPCVFKKEFFSTETLTISIPKMFGKFSIFTPTERELFRTNLLHPDKNYAYYIEDIIEIKYPNISKYGDTVPFNISEKSPVKAYFWFAENIKSRRQNNLSNYTTNAEESSHGYNPCIKYELKYGTNIKDNGEFNRSELTESYEMFPGTSDVIGYNVYCNCFDTESVQPEPAIVLDKLKASFTITLGDSNPYNQTTDREIAPPQAGRLDLSAIISSQKEFTTLSDEVTFDVYLILLVIKKIQMRWTDKKVEFNIIDPNTATSSHYDN